MAQMITEDMRKIVIVAAGVVLLGVILFFLLPTLTRGKGGITINTVPSETNIVFDGKDHKSPAKLTDIPSGNHIIEVIKEGFKTRLDEISIVSNTSTEITLRLYSSETSPTAIRANLTEFKEPRSDIEKLASFLPFSNEKFKIEIKTVGRNPSVQITLYAIINKPSQHARFEKDIKSFSVEALKWIESKEVDPENIDIKWEPVDPSRI